MLYINMSDKDKLFLILYFEVKNSTIGFKTNQIMYGLYENIRKSLDDTVKVFIIPQRTTDEVKFEILNVKDASDEKIQELIDISNKYINNINHQN